MTREILILFAFILFVGCVNPINDFQPFAISPVQIGSGNLYGNGNEKITKQNLVIATNLAWTELIGKMNSVNNETKNFAETNIDFSKFMVLAIFDEVKGSGGYSISIKGILKNQDNLTVTVQKTAPAGSAYAVVTQPYCIVKIPVTTKKIIFE
jgi:hypothetical protein